jgi:hypothetical protein
VRRSEAMCVNNPRRFRQIVETCPDRDGPYRMKERSIAFLGDRQVIRKVEEGGEADRVRGVAGRVDPASRRTWSAAAC